MAALNQSVQKQALIRTKRIENREVNFSDESEQIDPGLEEEKEGLPYDAPNN